MSKQFKVWIDGNEQRGSDWTDFGIIEAENMGYPDLAVFPNNEIRFRN